MNKPTLTIEYCPLCGWLMRSAWMAQELLTTFSDELGQVALRPAETGGVFRVWLNDSDLLFDRKQAGGFPEIKILKQLVRDHVAPQKNLGHSDSPSTKA